MRVNELVPTDEVLELTREQLGLNKPFLVRYADWMSAVAHGDLGRRYVDNKPVAQELARALPWAGTGCIEVRALRDVDAVRRRVGADARASAHDH